MVAEVGLIGIWNMLGSPALCGRNHNFNALSQIKSSKVQFSVFPCLLSTLKKKKMMNGLLKHGKTAGYCLTKYKKICGLDIYFNLDE